MTIENGDGERVTVQPGAWIFKDAYGRLHTSPMTGPEDLHCTNVAAMHFGIVS